MTNIGDWAKNETWEVNNSKGWGHHNRLSSYRNKVNARMGIVKSLFEKGGLLLCRMINFTKERPCAKEKAPVIKNAVEQDQG